MKGIGIKYQLRIATLIPVMLVALFFAVFYNGQFIKDMNQQAIRLGESYIRQLLPAAQLAITHHNTRLLQGLIDASAANSDITTLAFYNADGQLLAYRGGKPSIYKQLKSLEHTGDYVESKIIDAFNIRFIAPITIPKHNLYSSQLVNASESIKILQPDEVLGWLSIDLNTQSTLIKRYKMYIITIVIILIGLIVSLTVHHFLSKQIYFPIARLRRSMKQILSNEFETHISATSKGELGIIEKGCSHLQQQYLATIRDLNNHIEVATADLQHELELLEEKNIELTLEKKKTEEKSRQKSEFIANMSHEIRTPMNGVIGFTNVLLESKLDPLQLDYVKTIKSSAQDLLTIINDILDYSKMDAGKLNLDCIPFDLRACVDEVLTLAAPNAHKKGLDLIPSTELNVPKTVLGDPVRIKQILTNLVNNAIKFTDRGQVLVKTSVEQELDKHYVLSVSVIDTGMGIAADDQTKLFNAFNQANTTVTRRFGGSGLGLVICKKLAEAMNGRISLASELQKGSTFTVRIKLEKFTSYEAEKHQNYRFEDIKAICYDDNAIHLEAICNGLEFLGIKCIPTHSLEELEKSLAADQQNSLIFVNLNEGTEKQITSILQHQKNLSIIISKVIIHDPKQLGANAVVYRPVTIQKLHETIEAILKQNSAEQQLKPDNQELSILRKELRIIQPEILIADDNPVNRMLLTSLLRDNAKVDAVNNGDDAVDACKQKSYHLILLDLQMPKLNGLKAANLIRQSTSLNKKAPIVLISAETDVLDKNAQKAAGINLFLQKPIDEFDLLKHLLELLNQRQSNAIDWELCIQKVSGNEALAMEFLQRFVQELRLNRDEFIQLKNEKNIQSLGSAAHKLQGACCFCGVPRLQAQVSRVENLAKTAKNIKDLETAFTEMIQSLDEVLDEFDSFYAVSSTN